MLLVVVVEVVIGRVRRMGQGRIGIGRRMVGVDVEVDVVVWVDVVVDVVVWVDGVLVTDSLILLRLLGSTQKFRRVDWTINLSLIAKFLVLGSIGDHWS